MEMNSIFGQLTSKDYHITDKDIPLTRSGFIHSKIHILYSGRTLEELQQALLKDNLVVDQYRIHFEKQDKIDYKIQLEAMRTLGFSIEGEFSLHHPKVEFAVSVVNGLWIFGTFTKNKHLWKTRRNKPYNYSNALDVILAKALINIAVQNHFDYRLVDPCCGIGTVIIEARAMNLNIKGYEINPFIKQNCNKNVEYFGYTPDIELLDMHEIKEQFDVAILDMPYGQYSSITKEEQYNLIQKAASISRKLILVTMEEMSDKLVELNHTILDVCRIKKTTVFSRYIYILTN